MSSKTGADRRPWSLAVRLTLWYAGSAFALVLVATGYLYLALVRQLEEEDGEWLAGKVGEVVRAAETRPGDTSGLRQLVEPGGGRAAERILVRVDDVRGPAPVMIETPGLSAVVPLGEFPDGSAAVRDFRSAEGRLYRLRTERTRDGAVVVRAAMDRTEDEVLLEGHRRRLSYVLVLSLVACTAGGYHIARRGVRPVEAIAATAGRIRPTNLDERIETRGLPAELRTLAGTFNGMLDRLQDALTRLTRFSADIAHELRTPVNNLRGAVEVALGMPRTPDEYRDVLASGLEECGRLARMIDSLLFLARAENPQTEVVREVIDVGRELSTVCEFYEATAAEAGVGLAVASAGPVAAEVNRPLFQRAVGNLVANAIAHTPPGGAVTLTAEAGEVSTRVEVADTGCGIPPDSLPHVFDRLFRVDHARSSAAGNVGLGLSIVKSVAELHGGTVEITSRVGQGTRVTMNFPRKMTKP